jgi:hypothetical protein
MAVAAVLRSQSYLGSFRPRELVAVWMKGWHTDLTEVAK